VFVLNDINAQPVWVMSGNDNIGYEIQLAYEKPFVDSAHTQSWHQHGYLKHINTNGSLPVLMY